MQRFDDARGQRNGSERAFLFAVQLDVAVRGDTANVEQLPGAVDVAALEDELPDECSELLRETQATYREATAEGSKYWAAYLAGVFQARLDRS